MTTSSSPQPEVSRHANPDDAARFAAIAIADALRAALAKHETATIALSGGRSPELMLRELTTTAVDWARVEVFQVDERMVATDDPDRNWAMIGRNLLDPAAIPAAHRHPMPVTSHDPQLAVDEYTALLRSRATRGLDVVHLGLGADGHTASWPPGDPVVDSPDDVAIVPPYAGHRRMTLTPRVVNRADQIVWLVTGSDKRPALARLLGPATAGPHTGDPSASVRRSPNVVIATDLPPL